MQPFCLTLVRTSLVKSLPFFLASLELLDLQFFAKDIVNIWSQQLDHLSPHLDLYYVEFHKLGYNLSNSFGDLRKKL